MKHAVLAQWALGLVFLCSIARVEAAEGRFIGDVVAKWLPNGRDMEMAQAFTYVDARGAQWTVPAGTVVDGASIPRVLWSVMGAPFTGKYRKASVVHDFFCQTMPRPWQDVHQTFYEASLAEGNDVFQAKLMYGAIYAWGPRWEMIDGRPVRTRDLTRLPSDTEFQDFSDWIKARNPSLQQIASHAQSRFPRTPSGQGRQVALVIGNAAYQNTHRLANPRNDAADMAALLKQLGYYVIEGLDLDKAGMDRLIRDFARAVSRAEAGVFFYAGHGLQVSGQNYLVPIDAKLEDASGLDFETVRLELIQRTMEREANTNVIFLDACRDNPWARHLRSLGTRSVNVGRGLAAVDSGHGTMISFSTQPGNVALDGSGRNSPFAEALVKRIKAAAATEDLSRLLIAVRNEVMLATANRQVPWENGALIRPFYFAAPAPPTQPSGLPAGSGMPKYDKEVEIEVWKTVRDSKSSVLVRAYLDRYPYGHFAPIARVLIEQLEKDEMAKAIVAQRQEEAAAAEGAEKAAAAQERRRLEAANAAKQSKELARAQEQLMNAQRAREEAEADRQVAVKALEQARREADEAKATLEEAERKAKAASIRPAAIESKDALPKNQPTGTDSKSGGPVASAMKDRPSDGMGQKRATPVIRAQLAKAKALRSVAIGKDGKTIAGGGDDGRLRLWSGADLKLTRTFAGHTERVSAIAFSPDGKLVASAAWDGTIRLWDLDSGAESHKYDTGAERLYSLTFEPRVPLEYVLAGDGQGLVHIWDVRKKARASKPQEHDGPVRAISFFPDRSGTFASIAADGKMRVRSFKTGVRNIEAHTGGGFFVAYSADGAYVLTAGGDKKVKLWQSSDFKLLRSFEGHAKYVLTAAFSPNGTRIASGGGDNAIILWDAQTGQSIRTLSGHEGDIESIAFYGDGSKLVSVSEDRTMRVWDVATGRQLASVVAFTDGEYVAFAPDGRYTGSPGAHKHLKMLDSGIERDVDDETKGRLFSPSGLALISR